VTYLRSIVSHLTNCHPSTEVTYHPSEGSCLVARMTSFADAIHRTRAYLVHNGRRVDTGHWQGVTTEGKPDLQTVELLGVAFECQVPQSQGQLQVEIQPNLPWADDHFAERVSRDPSNPGEQYKNWPWWRPEMEEFTASRDVTKFQFTHTYQERYWPRFAGEDPHFEREGAHGIRYSYGDLDDVVSQLLRQPYTRQAWLPIFFPEDTGAVHGGRVPCTLGYQFMLRNDRLHMWYVIRSCEYLSARLLLWVLGELQQRSEEARQFLTEGTGFEDHSETLWDRVKPGIFHFHCFSMHYHRGDEHLL
jgi:hypothetical protein